MESTELKKKLQTIEPRLNALEDWKSRMDDLVEIVDTIKDKEGAEDLAEWLQRRRREREVEDQ